MRILAVVLVLICPLTAASQFRAFDNSKAVMPWLYNPAADLSRDLHLYAGYDGRGRGNFMPQSVVAGLRMPIQGGNRFRGHGPVSMAGVQLLQTSHDLLKSSTISASFAHEIPLTRKAKIAMGLGAGIFSMRYNYDALVFLDQQDPLLNDGENFFNIHLNAGLAFVVEDQFFVQLAAPYIIKDGRANVREIIFRAGYVIPVNADMKLTVAANLDTHNRDLVFGGDVRAAWRETVSFIAGADRYKYHGGILLAVKPFALGYTYGLNFRQSLDYVPTHQLAVFGKIPVRR